MFKIVSQFEFSSNENGFSLNEYHFNSNQKEDLYLIFTFYKNRNYKRFDFNKTMRILKDQKYLECPILFENIEESDFKVCEKNEMEDFVWQNSQRFFPRLLFEDKVMFDNFKLLTSNDFDRKFYIISKDFDSIKNSKTKNFDELINRIYGYFFHVAWINSNGYLSVAEFLFD